jgi:endonuclease-8
VPEGPEIRIAADRIADVLVGEVVEGVEIAFPALKHFETTLSGCRVEAVETRGKAMLTRFDNGLTLYSHNQLYGRWFTARRGETPNTRRSLRVALHTAEKSALLYSASDVEVLDADGVAAHRFLSKLGPDLLDPELTENRLAERLASERFRRRSVAALYLDQSFVAGLGNYLRSEILFCAGVAPERRPGDLDAAQRAALARETLRLGWRSYRTRGITLDDEVLAGLPRGPRRKRFWVFARAGQRCYRCRARIGKEIRGSRRLYRCPTCQV